MQKNRKLIIADEEGNKKKTFQASQDSLPKLHLEFYLLKLNNKQERRKINVVLYKKENLYFIHYV